MIAAPSLWPAAPLAAPARWPPESPGPLRASISCSACRSRMPCSISHSGKRDHRIARALRLPARPWSCTASRRRKASANTAGCTCACTSAGPRPARQYAAASLQHSVGRHEIGAVHLEDAPDPGNPASKLRDIAARRLLLHRNRDRVAVVLHQEHHRQPFQAGRIHGFPELAFAGGALRRRRPA